MGGQEVVMIVLRNVARISVKPKFGYVPDLPDDGRDRLLGSTPVAYVDIGEDREEIDHTHYFKAVSDQMEFPSCTANSSADVWEAYEIMGKVEGGMSLGAAINGTPDLSRMFLWWCGRNLIDPPKTRDPSFGCYNRLIMDALARYGAPPEELWPYDDAPVGAKNEPRSIVRPSIKAYRAAASRAATAFYSINDVGEARHLLLRKALKAKHLPIFGTSLTKSFFGYTNGVIHVPQAGPIAGHHSMAIVGWSPRRNAYKVRNSWTAYWGEGGYCWMHKNYVISDLSSGFWVVSRTTL